MLPDLIRTVLFVAVAFALRAALTALNVEISEELFNTLVAAIVGYFLALLGYEGVKVAVNKARPGTLK